MSFPRGPGSKDGRSYEVCHSWHPHKDISSGFRDQIAYFKKLGFFFLINENPGREVAWNMGGTKLCGARTMNGEKRANVLLLEGGMPWLHGESTVGYPSLMWQTFQRCTRPYKGDLHAEGFELGFKVTKADDSSKSQSEKQTASLVASSYSREEALSLQCIRALLWLSLNGVRASWVMGAFLQNECTEVKMQA